MKTTFKLAFRNLVKRKFYSLLNVLGLAVGIAFSYLTWLYVQDQSSYDSHFKDADRIYRVGLVYGDRVQDSYADIPLASTLVEEYSKVESATFVRRIGQYTTLANQKRNVKSQDVFASDPHFFEVFDVGFLDGNKETALDEPYSIVISESYAKQLFDDINVVGKIIKWSGETAPTDVKITGVFKDLDPHTHLPLKALVSIRSYYTRAEINEWGRRKAYTYVKLNLPNDIEGLRAEIPGFIQKYLSKRIKKTGQSIGLSFQPLMSIYLDPERLWEPYPHGSRTNLQVLSIVVFFLLIIACFNYVNLATAMGIERAKEVGIRKILGSSEFHLSIQFLTESILIALVSGILALILCSLLLSHYSDITDISLDTFTFFAAKNIFKVLLISLGIGLIAGIYPAIYLSGLTSNIRLLGSFLGTNKTIQLRKALVTSQYVISSILIVGLLIIWSQTNYIKEKDIGYDKQNLIQIAVPDDRMLLGNVKPFLNELRGLTQVRGASITEYDLYTYREQGDLEITNHHGISQKVELQSFWAGQDFIKTIGAEIINGRGFDQSLDDSLRFFLVNQTAVDAYGWKGNETELSRSYKVKDGATITWTCLGVVSDFILGASYQKQKPMILFYDNKPRSSSNLLVAFENGRIKQSIDMVKDAWSDYFPSQVFEYQYVEDNLNALYSQEERFLNFLSVLCLIVIFITSLSITGLISFTTETKKKEIAIRKVNGAQVKSILSLLSKQFITLLLIANLIAIPVGHYLMKQWLANFEQRIDLSIWPFMLSIVVCLIFTSLASFYHTIKAVRENPINALQHE